MSEERTERVIVEDVDNVKEKMNNEDKFEQVLKERREMKKQTEEEKMSDENIILTKQEIGDAITNYIGVFKKGQSFFPYKIIGTDQKLQIPKDVMFFLDYIPKGSTIEKSGHNIYEKNFTDCFAFFDICSGFIFPDLFYLW